MARLVRNYFINSVLGNFLPISCSQKPWRIWDAFLKKCLYRTHSLWQWKGIAHKTSSLADKQNQDHHQIPSSLLVYTLPLPHRLVSFTTYRINLLCCASSPGLALNLRSTVIIWQITPQKLITSFMTTPKIATFCYNPKEISEHFNLW